MDALHEYLLAGARLSVHQNGTVYPGILLGGADGLNDGRAVPHDILEGDGGLAPLGI